VKSPESIYKELVSYSKNQDRYIDLQRLLMRFGIECFYRRLEKSPFRTQFVLKGAMLLAVLLQQARNTKDADFQVSGRFSPGTLKKLFAEICSIEESDGTVFNLNGITVKEAGKNRGYIGYIVKIPATLASATISLQFDVGFGEIITPGPILTKIPTLLGFRDPVIQRYPLSTVFAEKFEALVDLGMRNGRMKDFYDLATFTVELKFDGAELSKALENTFQHRKTPLPTERPLALTEAFFGDKSKNKEYMGFLRTSSLPKNTSLERCCTIIWEFIAPVLSTLKDGKAFAGDWKNGEWCTAELTESSQTD